MIDRQTKVNAIMSLNEVRQGCECYANSTPIIHWPQLSFVKGVIVIVDPSDTFAPALRGGKAMG
jgi:hypothetical protein